MKYFLILVVLVSFSGNAQSDDVLLNNLKAELERQKSEFSSLSVSPYYFSFKVEEIRTNDIQVEFGSIIYSEDDFGRIGNTEVRVGDYAKDNTSSTNSYGSFNAGIPLPIDDEKDGLNLMLWLVSDIKYKMAEASFASLSEETKGDKQLSFSKESPVQYYEKPFQESVFDFDKTGWETKLMSLSEKANHKTNIISNSVALSRKITRKYFLSSEGSSIVQNQKNCLLSLNLSIVDSTGNEIPISKTYSANELKDLPSIEVIQADMDALIAIADKLVNAPYVEPYSGPILFSGKASAVFFHEVLGHRIEAERLSQISDGQTFKNKLGLKILPKNITVSSRPLIDEFNGMKLTGGYEYDDQGIKAKNVTVIENGILREFLLSRKPLGKFNNSNGHARSSEGGSPTSRQANLIIEGEKGLEMSKLRSLLIKECKKQDKAFGYFIDEVEGGYTTTDRYQPNTINISPIVVYKVFVDGREDELVKGMNLTGTPLNAFSEIIAIGNLYESFNGYCGAESGYIPVSAVSPALLLGKLEIQRKPVFKMKLPILPPPTVKK
jgi:TldD protein